MDKTIEVSFPGGKRVDGKIENMIIKTDQPVEEGGGGSAPEPFNLFLMSIATCAGIYALDFCQAREIETCLLYTSPSPRDKIHDLVFRLLI